MIVSESRLQKALTYLAETDESAANAKALMIGIENQEKTILGTVFLEMSGTVAEREAGARSSQALKDWQSQYKDAVYNYEILRNKRNTESLIVEVWRSLNANQRKGNI